MTPNLAISGNSEGQAIRLAKVQLPDEMEDCVPQKIRRERISQGLSIRISRSDMTRESVEIDFQPPSQHDFRAALVDPIRYPTTRLETRFFLPASVKRLVHKPMAFCGNQG